MQRPDTDARFGAPERIFTHVCVWRRGISSNGRIDGELREDWSLLRAPSFGDADLQWPDADGRSGVVERLVESCSCVARWNLLEWMR